MEKQDSKEEIQVRIERVYQMLLLGLREREIWRNLSEGKTNPYTKSLRTLERDIRKARALLEEDAAPGRKLALGRSKARLELLFLKSMTIQDYKSALAVVREINELFGLHEPTKFSVELPELLIK